MLDKDVRYVIVDDDPVSVSVLNKFAEKVSDLKCQGTYTSGLDFLNSGNHDVDLVFMDVEMPEINGLDTINTLNTKPVIVLVSSFVEYAYDAFEHDVADYLLKPVNKARFLKSVNKVRGIIEHRTYSPSQNTASERVVFIKHKDVFVRVYYRDIQFIQSQSEYVEIVTEEQTFLHYGALKKLVQTFPDNFLRVHRSYIVNLNHVVSYGLNSLEVGGQIIPVSKSYSQKLKEKIATLN